MSSSTLRLRRRGTAHSVRCKPIWPACCRSAHIFCLWSGVSHGGALTLRRLRFEDQVAPRQGAVAANNGTMVVAGCAFVQCSSLGVGGALVNREGGLLLIQSAPPPSSSSSSPYDDDVGVRRESRFEGNRAVFGGALFNFNGALGLPQSTPRSADF